MTYDVQDELCDTIKDDIEIETEANVYEPSEEFVKQVEEKLLEDIFDELENDMHADAID
jgi:hypothetical protein